MSLSRSSSTQVGSVGMGLGLKPDPLGSFLLCSSGTHRSSALQFFRLHFNSGAWLQVCCDQHRPSGGFRRVWTLAHHRDVLKTSGGSSVWKRISFGKGLGCPAGISGALRVFISKPSRDIPPLRDSSLINIAQQPEHNLS